MTKDLQNLVKEASAAAEYVKDPALKAVAFDRILQHLLERGAPSHAATAEAKPPRRAKRKPAKSRRAASSNGGASKDGPMAWLEELVDEGFFDEPRSGTAMVDRLAERGHHVTYQDLTRQLKMLTQDKKLRRKKLPVEEGAKRQVWHYSKW